MNVLFCGNRHDLVSFNTFPEVLFTKVLQATQDSRFYIWSVFSSYLSQDEADSSVE